MSNPRYRIEYTIERCDDEESQQFYDIGFGSSGTCASIDVALDMVESEIANRNWETDADMPDPKDAESDDSGSAR